MLRTDAPLAVRSANIITIIIYLHTVVQMDPHFTKTVYNDIVYMYVVYKKMIVIV